MSLPSRAYIKDVQRVFADVMKNAEGDSVEFDTVVARVHQRLRPGKRKPSLSHRKWTLDAVLYEVNAYRLSVTNENDPKLVTITTTGSAYYFDLVSLGSSDQRRVTKKDAIARYLDAAAMLEPIKDAVAEFASMVHCVENFPDFILQHLELESRLRDENQAMIHAAQDFEFQFDHIQDALIPGA